jgi:hypothetical protein
MPVRWVAGTEHNVTGQRRNVPATGCFLDTQQFDGRWATTRGIRATLTRWTELMNLPSSPAGHAERGSAKPCRSCGFERC